MKFGKRSGEALRNVTILIIILNWNESGKNEQLFVCENRVGWKRGRL